MKLTNKIITKIILILTLIAIFSTVVNAIAVSDGFRNGLLSVNNFFSGQQFQPYAQAIDFFFFSLFFIALYMMGARYAFKEMKRPEQVIVILLGLMTAFLLVLAGWSATVLLPYIHWIFYILLFALWYWLLKGIKSKFWRFILALLLTLLTIYLLSLLLSGFVAPDASGYISPFFESLKGISFPELPGPPGIPSGISDLFGPPSAPPPTGPSTLPPTPTPDEGGGFFGFLKDWWWVPILLFAIIYGLYRLRRGRRGRGRGDTGEDVDEIIRKIEEYINAKAESNHKIKAAHARKIELLRDATRLQAYLMAVTDADVALLWTDPNREVLRNTRTDFVDILEEEFELIDGLKKLRDIEILINTSLDTWKEEVLRKLNEDITTEVNEINQLLGRRVPAPFPDFDHLQDVGIIYLFEMLYDIEKKDISLDKELTALLTENNIETFVLDKFRNVRPDFRRVAIYTQEETKIITELDNKIRRQIEILNRLRVRLRTAQITPTVPTSTSIKIEATNNNAPWAGDIELEITRPDTRVYKRTITIPAAGYIVPIAMPGDYKIKFVSGGPTGDPPYPVEITKTILPSTSQTFKFEFGTRVVIKARVPAATGATDWTGPINVTLTDPAGATETVNTVPYTKIPAAPGNWIATYNSGGPAGLSLSGAPTRTDTLAPAHTIEFIFDFVTSSGPTTGTVTFIANESGTNRPTGNIDVQGIRAGGGTYPAQSVSLNIPIPNFAEGDWAFTWLPTNPGSAPSNTPLTVTVPAGGNVNAVFMIGGGGATGEVVFRVNDAGTFRAGNINIEGTNAGGGTITQTVLLDTPVSIPIGTWTFNWATTNPGPAPTNPTIPNVPVAAVGPNPQVIFNFGGGAPRVEIRIAATLDGNPVPAPFMMRFRVTRAGRGSAEYQRNIPHRIPTAPAGTYTFEHVSGAPPGATFGDVTPSGPQNLVAAPTPHTFTFNFVTGGSGGTGDSVIIKVKVNGVDWPAAGRTSNMSIRVASPTGVILVHRVPHIISPAPDGDYHVEWLTGRGAGGPTAARIIGTNPQRQRKVAGRDLEFVFEFARGGTPPPRGTKKRKTSGAGSGVYIGGNIDSSIVNINSPNSQNTYGTAPQHNSQVLKNYTPAELEKLSLQIFKDINSITNSLKSFDDIRNKIRQDYGIELVPIGSQGPRWTITALPLQGNIGIFMPSLQNHYRPNWATLLTNKTIESMFAITKNYLSTNKGLKNLPSINNFKLLPKIEMNITKTGNVQIGRRIIKGKIDN